jgi:ABC-type nickel/cobalt efflux system permease component RcnA
LTLLTSIGGVFTKYSFQLRNVLKPTLSKIFHAFFAIVAYVLAIITIILGFRQMWFLESDDYMRPIITILLILAAIYVVAKSFVTMASRAKDFFGK